MEERKYFVKQSWIFNLEAMHDKLYCITYDVREGTLSYPLWIAGKKCENDGDVYSLIQEAEELEWIAKCRKVTGSEYGRIKKMVTWRVEQRYARCMASGMSERDAGVCFQDI